MLQQNAALKDMVLGHMAQDIEVGIKVTAGTPVSNTKASGNKRGGGGHMKAAVRHFRNADNQFRVEVDKEYAAYQERGMRADGTRVVRNYSTGGTGRGWFRRAIEGVTRNANNYVDEAAKAVGFK